MCDQITFLNDQVTRKDEQLTEMSQALAACAYWAASGLRYEDDHTSNVAGVCSASHVMLTNILKESKEYAISEPGCDNNIMFEGFEYTYTPVGGWPEPEKERM